ncbi:MAG: hypothetical protein PHX78_11905 [bacterium]|nr:hypothetical protein [bacterium]
MSKKSIFLFLCVNILFACPISADEYHNQQVLVGEKAAGLGGTFVAIGDGAEACYYNPAGLTQLKIAYLSVSSQIIEYKEIKGKFVDRDTKLTSMSFVPSFWGFAKDVGGYKFGFSIVVPEFDASEMHEHYNDIQYISLPFNAIRIDQTNNDQTYLIGPSIAKKINPNLSFGATLYLRYSNISERNTQYFNLDTSGAKFIMEDNLEKSGKALGGMGIFGLLYKPGNEIKLGLSLKLNTSSANTIDIMNRNYKFGSGLSPSLNGFNNAYSENQVKYNSIVPPVIVLGSSWQASKKINFAADISYQPETDYNTKTYGLDTATLTTYEEKTDRIELKNVFNINFGTEYMLDNNIPFRFGFFTDKSTAPKVSGSKLDNNGDLARQPIHVDNYGVTVSSGILSQNSTMVFGIKYGWGNGRVTNLGADGAYHIEKIKTLNYAFNLSGSYNF